LSSLMIPPPPPPTPFPYTTLFRSKAPIKAAIFGKVDRGDHTVEKVYFESYPGFYVTGNLYRPKSVAGKIPAVLCPHGHWTYGRRSEEHTSELQSLTNLVCRLLLPK